MMRSAGGALAVAVAALIVCCSADPHQEQDVGGNDHSSGERYDAAGHKTRALEPHGGGNLVREAREIRHSAYMPYLISRRYDFGIPYGGKREPWPLAPIEYSGYYGDGLPKRNFDEIDRSGLDTFLKKRNFDEIDRSSMPFPYATKRFYHMYGPNYLDIDVPVPYGGKREPWPLAPIEYSGYYGDGLPKRNFDEIDRSGLDTFLKKRNFDEIDRSSMPFPYATKHFYHISSFDKKRYRPDSTMDEIDLSQSPIGSKRSEDSYPLVPRNIL